VRRGGLPHRSATDPHPANSVYLKTPDVCPEAIFDERARTAERECAIA